MMHRPDLADRPVGEVLIMEGRPMRHVGEGCFLPVEPIMKRFAPDEGDLLLKAS